MPPDRRPRDAWRNPVTQGAVGRPGSITPTSPAKGPKRRWLLPALVLGALVGLIAGIVALYPHQPPDPILLAIPVTQYAHPDWPSHPWAEADARGFRDRFGGDSAQAFQVQEKGRILRELNQLAEDSRGKNRGRPIVVDIAALALPVESGVAIIPGDGKPDDPTTWLTVDDLLQPLRRTDSPRLLILDLRPCAGPRTLVVGEDVSERLEAQLTKLEQSGDLPFFVLTSGTASGAVDARALRALKHTAFGLALSHAAGGAADGWGGGKKDGRIWVRELADATRDFTRHAATTAGFLQTPRLFGRADDISLLPVPSTGPAALPTLADADPLPPWLTEAWQTNDRLTKTGLHLRAPRVAWNFSLATARAELQLNDGKDPTTTRDQFQAATADLPAAESAARPNLLPLFSVAQILQDPLIQTRLAGWKTPPDDKTRAEAEALERVFDLIRNSGTAKPDAILAAMQGVWAKPPEPAPYLALSVKIVTTANQLTNPTGAELWHISNFAKGFKPTPRLPELALIDLIAGLPDDLLRRWPPGTIASLLRLKASSELATVHARRVAPWMIGNIGPDTTIPADGPLARLDAKHRQILLTLTDPEVEDTAYRNAAERIEDVKREYEQAATLAAAIDAARLQFEETRAVLADLATHSPHELTTDPDLVQKTWSALVEEAKQLRDALRVPTVAAWPDPERLSRMDRATESVKTNRPKLTKLRDVRLPTMSGSAVEQAAASARLLQSSRDIVGRVLAQWPMQAASGGQPQESGRTATLQKQAVRDLKRLIDLLSIAECPGVESLERDWQKLTGQPSAEAVLLLARKVRTAWVETLPAEFRKADRIRRSAMGWAIHPNDLPVATRPGLGFDPNPEAGLERDTQSAVHRWLGAQRYRAEAKLLRRENRDDIPKAVREYTATLEAIARDNEDWKP